MSQSAPLFSEHDRQVDALLSQMTLDEKIGQMVQVDSGALADKAEVQKYFLGSVLSGGSSDPAAGETVAVQKAYGDFLLVTDHAGHSGWVSKTQVTTVVPLG